MKKSTLYGLVDKALGNAEEDRDQIKEVLYDLIEETNTRPDKKSGMEVLKHLDSAKEIAKHIENLQRSNEQIIKLASILEKKEKEMDEEVLDTDSIYDHFQDNDGNSDEEVELYVEDEEGEMD